MRLLENKVFMHYRCGLKPMAKQQCSILQQNACQHFCGRYSSDTHPNHLRTHPPDDFQAMLPPHFDGKSSQSIVCSFTKISVYLMTVYIKKKKHLHKEAAERGHFMHIILYVSILHYDILYGHDLTTPCSIFKDKWKTSVFYVRKKTSYRSISFLLVCHFSTIARTN